MKNILLLVHDDAGQEARLQAALDVTRAVEGHITCLDVVMTPVLAAADYWSGGATAMLLENQFSMETANRARMEKRLADEGVAWSWSEMSGDLAPAIERASILSELIVVNRGLEGFPFPDRRSAAADLVVRSGKPILAVPDEVTGFAAAGRALVAWDGSAQADAALQASIPLLALAAHVTLIEVDDGSVTVPAEQAASLLLRYGIHSLVVREPARKRDVSNMLLHEIADRRIDYLVMGGFGHSRLFEALLGGVTHTLLTKSPVPLLLHH